jgi:hypothetical protein
MEKTLTKMNLMDLLTNKNNYTLNGLRRGHISIETKI